MGARLLRTAQIRRSTTLAGRVRVQKQVQERRPAWVKEPLYRRPNLFLDAKTVASRVGPVVRRPSRRATPPTTQGPIETSHRFRHMAFLCVDGDVRPPPGESARDPAGWSAGDRALAISLPRRRYPTDAVGTCVRLPGHNTVLAGGSASCGRRSEKPPQDSLAPFRTVSHATSRRPESFLGHVQPDRQCSRRKTGRLFRRWNPRMRRTVLNPAPFASAAARRASGRV